jgi:hypothetical protein
MKTEYPNIPLLGELNFEVSIYDKKYAYRFYTDGKSELIRKGVLWDRNTLGDRLILAMAQEIYELRQKLEPRAAMTAHQFVDIFLTKIRIPTTDGASPAPLPIGKVRELLVTAIAEDRAAGAVINIDRIVNQVCGWDLCSGDQVSGDSVRNMVRLALQYAQASGARFPAQVPTEDDYVEAVSVACEAFTSALKDKGFMP